MIQQVVAGGDLIEHRADRGCGACFVPGPLWLSSRRRHGYLPLPESRRIDSMAANTSASVTSSATTALPMPCSRTKRRTPARFFLSPDAACNRRLPLIGRQCWRFEGANHGLDAPRGFCRQHLPLAADCGAAIMPQAIASPCSSAR